jgi:hypothetical protein
MTAAVEAYELGMNPAQPRTGAPVGPPGAVEKSFVVLERVAASPQPLGVSELARQTGLPILLVGVWRAGFAHWWVPLVAGIGYGASLLVPYGPVTIVMWGAAAVALGSLGVRMLRMSREEWISHYPTTAPGRTTPDSYANTTA